MKVKISYSPTLNELNELDLALLVTPGKDFIIGRSPDSDLVLDGPDVSRIHARFFIQGGNYYFADLGSRNGSIINGELASKNSPIILRDKDVIRIGDYILTTEEIIPFAQQLPETVIKAIDPALFSNWRGTQNVNEINVANATPEVVGSVSEPVLQKSERETQEIINPVIPEELEEAIITPENIISTPEVVSEISAPVINEAFDYTPAIGEEITFIQPDDLASQTPVISAEAFDSTSAIGEEITFIQPDDLASQTPVVSAEAFDSTSTIGEEITFIQPDDLASQTPAVSAEALDLPPTIGEEITFIQPDDLASQTPIVSAEAFDSTSAIGEDSTFVQPRDLESQPPANASDESEFSTPIYRDFTIYQPRDLESQPPANASDESDFSTPIYRDFTIYQPRDLESQPPANVSEESGSDTEIYQDFTIYQPRDLESQPPANVSDESQEVVEPVAAEIIADIEEVAAPSVVNDVTSSDIPVVSEVPTQVTDEAVVLSPVNLEEFTTDVWQEDNPEAASVNEVAAQVTEEPVNVDPVNLEEFTTDVWQEDSRESQTVSEAPAEVSEVSQVVTTPDENVEASPEIAEVFSNQYIDLTATNTEQITVNGAEVEAAQFVSSVTAQTSEVDELTNNESATITAVTEELTDVNVSELVSEEIELVNPTPAEVSESTEPQTEENLEVINVSEPQQNQMIIQKNIVLIAHESKKSELAEFVAKHQEFFSRSLTVSWPSVSEVLSEQAGLTVSQQIPPATSGGYQQIYSLVNSGDVLAVIFLRDFLVPQPGQANEEALLRTCNINEVLLATNLATAEAIAHYLKHTAQ